MKRLYLFTDWGFALSNFKIYDSFETMNLIIERKTNPHFNIDDIKREIESYSKIYNVKLCGIKETLKDIHDKGLSYTDKEVI